MNYNLKINTVDLAAFLIALGFEMKNYTVTAYIDLNDRNRKRPKSGSWDFADNSKNFTELGDCKSVIEKYKLPTKGEPIKNMAELAKLTAHNYQVLKSVLTENKPLLQIIGDGYTVLKNDNGASIPISNSTLFKFDETTDLMTVAIGCAMGCKIGSYYFDENKQLHITLYAPANGITIKRIEDAKNNEAVEDLTNYEPLNVLLATSINRKELMKGIYNKERICLIRGDKRAYFDKNADEELKKKILERMNY